MNSRYKSVQTIRVRVSEEELQLIKVAELNSGYKTLTSFIRAMFDEAFFYSSSLQDNHLKIILAEDSSVNNEFISKVREFGVYINETNKFLSMTSIKDETLLINNNLKSALIDLNRLISNKNTSLELMQELSYKENVTKKEEKLNKEMNSSFTDIQIDYLNSLFAMSNIRSFSNFLRVMILSLITNGHYIINIKASSNDLNYQLSKISSNLIQATYKENISLENKELIQALQLSIARLSVTSYNAKNYSLINRTVGLRALEGVA